jgi:hypothetical protein
MTISVLIRGVGKIDLTTRLLAQLSLVHVSDDADGLAAVMVAGVDAMTERRATRPESPCNGFVDDDRRSRSGVISRLEPPVSPHAKPEDGSIRLRRDREERRRPCGSRRIAPMHRDAAA